MQYDSKRQAGIQITKEMVAAGDKFFRSHFYDAWEMTDGIEMENFIRQFYAEMVGASTGYGDAVSI